jgi:chemotaxis protein MotB
MSDCECVETKCEEGIPAWVMTFADLMSLLLAFFVLLFSFSEMDKNVYKEMAGSLKDAFGVQREIKVKESPRGINIIAREFSPGRPQPTTLNEVRQITTDESRLHPVFTDPAKDGQENQDKKADDAEDKSFNATQKNDETTLSEEDVKLIELIQRDSELLGEVLEEEINQEMVEMKVTSKRIILMVREKGSFSSGSADVIEPFKVVASKIGKVFSDFDGVIIVSGHTDNVPIKTYRFRSNWELSSSRAVSVIQELVKEKALKAKRFEIAAFADTKPVDTNETYLGRAKNRRVEIMMDYSNNKEKQEAELAIESKVMVPTVENKVMVNAELLPEIER